MNRNLLTIALVSLAAGFGPVRADDDLRDFYRKRAEQEREYREKLDEWRREDARRLERRRREDQERLRERTEELREDAQEFREDLREGRVPWGTWPVYPAPSAYSRGYRGYVPVGPLRYPIEPFPLLGIDERLGYPAAAPRVVVPPWADNEPGYVVQPPTGTINLAAEADALIEQSGAFIQVFSQTGGQVPEARRQLNEAQDLNEAARAFRELLSAGATAGQLDKALQRVENSWGRMSRRTERLAQGRTGPNIEQVRLMGLTIDRMRQALSY
jgi:hypothetical protein